MKASRTMKKIRTILLSFTTLSLLSCVADLSVTGLRCCDLVNPEAVSKPVFSWQLSSTKPDIVQTAYELEIATSENALKNGKCDVRSSGEQMSNRQLGVKLNGFRFDDGCKYWWRVRVKDASGKFTAWSKPASFAIGISRPSARWITAQRNSDEPLPLFRKTFTLDEKPSRAVVYLSGLGCSDLYVNGALVEPSRILDPAQTNYEQYALYSAFDVTALLRKGNNCLGVALGDGWYNQNRVWGRWPSYGKPLMLLQMNASFKNGSTLTIASDETWQWRQGATLSSNIYAGEVYDARQAPQRWAEPDSNEEGWKSARSAVDGRREVTPPEVHPQLIEPIRMQTPVEAVDMWQLSDTAWIYDFGVNMAAIPLLSVKQPAGTHLKMRTGEILNDDRSIDFSTTGVFATGVVQTEEYICSGLGQETWSPRFTYHGFRYLELTGAHGKPEKSWIKAVPVYTDLEQTGFFECSEPQINHLHELAIRTMLSNVHGLPTDCPQREKCGWLGDAHTVAPFECMNFRMYNFWMKYMDDIASTASKFEANTLHHKLHNTIFYWSDKAAGIPYMIAPGKRLCGVASPDWGTAVVQIPYYIYLYYGVKEPLEKYYRLMSQWVDYIDTLAEEHIVPYGLGDWCPPEGNETIDCPIPLSSTMFHFLDASLMSEIAAILGKSDDVVRFAAMRDSTGKAISEKYYDAEAATFGSQTADAMAIMFGLAPAATRADIAASIVRNMNEKYNSFLHTGIFGVGRIGQALTRNGAAKAAYELFTKKGDNSFEYMWKHAQATTLWEVLPVNALSEKVGRGSSLNHPMLGAYDVWFYEDIAGLRPQEAGYKVIRFEPLLTGYLEWARATIETPYGKAETHWQKKDGKLKWHIVIPPNTSAIVVLPEGGTLIETSVGNKRFVEGSSPSSKTLPKALNSTNRATETANRSYTFPSGEFELVISL